MKTDFFIHLNEEGRPYPHYWELCVGSCHAATLLRKDVQDHIAKAHREIGFKYIRFHGLFDNDMSVVIDSQFLGGGQRQISFFNIDRIFDFLLSIGMKPFVEIGFMPDALASEQTGGFYYKNNVSMPNSDEAWKDLITQFARHLEDRYGAEEVRSWFFEVWNEPNLGFFFAGTQEDYFHLYEMTARSLKGVDEKIRVGGPASSNNMWIPEFKNFCDTHQVPYDFITTHHYPSDDPLSRAGMNGPGKRAGDLLDEMKKMEEMTPEEIQKIQESFNHPNTNPRDILYQMTRKAKNEAGDTPLYYTEWNAGHFDDPYAAAGIVMTIAYNEGMVEGYSYWCVSDIFEEGGLAGIPFHDEFGLVNVYGIPKPSFRIFAELHKAGDRRLTVTTGPNASRTAEVLALSTGTCVTLFAYNHDIEARDIQEEQMALHLDGDYQYIRKAVIDSTHTNPKAVWQAMGSPSYPTKKQLCEIEAASELVYEKVTADKNGQLEITALPESVTILQIVK